MDPGMDRHVITSVFTTLLTLSLSLLLLAENRGQESPFISHSQMVSTLLVEGHILTSRNYTIGEGTPRLKDWGLGPLQGASINCLIDGPGQLGFLPAVLAGAWLCQAAYMPG